MLRALFSTEVVAWTGQLTAASSQRSSASFRRASNERAVQQWVEADEAGLRMEPRRFTQCSLDLGERRGRDRSREVAA